MTKCVHIKAISGLLLHRPNFTCSLSCKNTWLKERYAREAVQIRVAYKKHSAYGIAQHIHHNLS